MKRLLSVLLILLISCGSALSEDVVGVWYANIDPSLAPDPSSMDNITHAIMICVFEESGEIIVSEVDYKGTKAEFIESGTIGKWEKEGNTFYTSIIAVGKDKVIFEDGMLYASIFNDKTYIGMRRMEPFDFYYNILRK